MTNIPDSLYTLIGVLIIANVGTIVSVIVAALRSVWWMSKLDSRVDRAQETGNRAHKRIDKLEDSHG